MAASSAANIDALALMRLHDSDSCSSLAETVLEELHT